MKRLRVISFFLFTAALLCAGQARTHAWDPEDWFDEEVETYECEEVTNFDYGGLYYDEGYGWFLGWPAYLRLENCDAEGIDCTGGNFDFDTWFACLEYCESIYEPNGYNQYPWVPDYFASGISDFGDSCDYYCQCAYQP